MHFGVSARFWETPAVCYPKQYDAGVSKTGGSHQSSETQKYEVKHEQKHMFVASNARES